MSILSIRNTESVEAGLFGYCLTWLIIVAGIAFGQIATDPSPGPHSPNPHQGDP